jgi:hypothetical protein
VADPASAVSLSVAAALAPAAARWIDTAAYLKWGCLLTGSQPVSVSRFAAVGEPSASSP